MRNGATIGSVPMASMSHDQLVLCSTWKDDVTTIFSGGCDKQVKMRPLLSGGQPVTVAMHDAPVKEVAWIAEMNLLASRSWDKSLRHWDLRQSNPVHTQQLPERCYSLSVKYPLMVVAIADINLIVFNLQNPQAEFKGSPLKYQTKCAAAFPDQQGFLVHHTFATVGSDGAFNFWDKDSKQRLKAMSRCSQPILSGTFNNDGSIYAYSEAEVKGKPRIRTTSRK